MYIYTHEGKGIRDLQYIWIISLLALPLGWSFQSGLKRCTWKRKKLNLFCFAGLPESPITFGPSLYSFVLCFLFIPTMLFPLCPVWSSRVILPLKCSPWKTSICSLQEKMEQIKNNSIIPVRDLPLPHQHSTKIAGTRESGKGLGDALAKLWSQTNWFHGNCHI